MNKKPLSGIQRNILKLYEVDHEVVNDSAKLLARYWWAYDKWNPELDLYSNLKNSTSPDSISRARRALHEFGYIEYSKKVEEMREELYKEHTEEYSDNNIFAVMREKINKGEL